MVESVGKKLHQARLQRGLTIDEAAHATKLRPDKIAALEGDDYSRFANNIYAKGFLQIYARFLKVDVTDFARTLDNSNPISVSDYQYLSNAPVNRRESNPVRIEERRAPSFAPLFFFIALIILGLGASWLWTTYQRVQNEEEFKAATAAARAATPAPNSDAAFIEDPPPRAAITPRPALATSTTPAPAPRIVPATPRATTPAPVAMAAPSPASPVPVATTTPRPTTPAPVAVVATPPPSNVPALLTMATPAPAKPPEQDFVTPAPVPTSDPTARPNGVNEVLVAAVKKTWVTVRKDDPKAPPIFEDYVYPNASPLKLRGARFFIEAREPASVQITKNGLPFAYQPTGVPVQ